MQEIATLPEHIADPDPNIYFSDNYLVLDSETTGIEYGAATNADNDLLLFVAGKGGDYTSYRGNELDMEALIVRVEEADFIVAQNAKFDLQWLIRCGLDLTKVVVYDTMIGKYVEDGNQPHLPKNLNALAIHYGLRAQKDNVVNMMIKAGICPSTIPFSWLDEYCHTDVLLTEDVFLEQRIRLEAKTLLPVLFTRCLLTVVLSDMEFNGMCLDPVLVEDEYYRKLDEKTALDKAMEECTGGINSRSPDQVSDFLFKTLKFSPPKKRGKVIFNKKGTHHPCGKEVIAGLKPTTKRQKDFIDLKQKLSKVDAAISKNMEFFQGVCKERGGIFYAQFNQTITKTQRLSSSGRPIKFDLFARAKSVQFQNMPRVYKPLFKARHAGWFLGEIDQAQLEFRVAGYLGADKQIYQDVINNEDIHSFTASVLNDVPLEWILANKNTDDKAKAMRTAAKADTFKPAFGGEKGTPAQEAYYQAFQKKYHELHSTQEAWCLDVLRDKSLTLPTGSKVFWPETSINKQGYINTRHKIYNLPIQHLATAEIVPIGVVYQWHRLKAAGMESFLVNTIHDSTIGEVHPDEVEEYKVIGELAFVPDTIRYLKTVYDMDFDMPLEAEPDMGVWWTIPAGKVNPLARVEEEKKDDKV